MMFSNVNSLRIPALCMKFFFFLFFLFSLVGCLSLDLEEETFENKKVIVCYFLARLAFFERCGKV